MGTTHTYYQNPRALYLVHVLLHTTRSPLKTLKRRLHVFVPCLRNWLSFADTGNEKMYVSHTHSYSNTRSIDRSLNVSTISKFAKLTLRASNFRYARKPKIYVSIVLQRVWVDRLWNFLFPNALVNADIYLAVARNVNVCVSKRNRARRRRAQQR